MKNLLALTFALILSGASAFAQGGGSKKGNSSPHDEVTKVGTLMADGLCDCFNKHYIKNLSSQSRKAIEKILKNEGNDLDNLEKILSQDELLAVANEAKTFEEDAGFNECQKSLEVRLQAEVGQLETVAETLGDAFEQQFMDAMVSRMRNNKKDCGIFYGFYLIGLKSGE